MDVTAYFISLCYSFKALICPINLPHPNLELCCFNNKQYTPCTNEPSEKVINLCKCECETNLLKSKVFTQSLY